MKLTDNLYHYPEHGPLDCNTYLIQDKTTVLIDPGSGSFLKQLTEDMEADGLDVGSIDLIVNTHLHLDHCSADESLKSISEARIGLHNIQKKYKKTALREVSEFFGINPPHLNEDVELNNQISTGKLEISILPTPGHSPDHICFYCRQDGFLICGDLIFTESTGRVDLPGGDKTKIRESIKEMRKLSYQLLLPGHMDIIRGREQIKKNFYHIKRFVLDRL